MTGLAEKDFTSDLIVWSGSFNRYGFDLKTAYASLKQDETTIKNYLNSKGISDSNIGFSAITTTKISNANMIKMELKSVMSLPVIL